VAANQLAKRRRITLEVRGDQTLIRLSHRGYDSNYSLRRAS
jgi:hypothetical protein